MKADENYDSKGCGMKCCPVENTIKYIGKKWTLNIVRDLFNDKKRFKDFLASNKKLSSRVLSERLRELETNGIVNKTIVNSSPILIEYELTKKGKALSKIICELALFTLKEFPEEVLDNPAKDSTKAKNVAKKMFAA